MSDEYTIQQYDRFEATFQPQRTDDLKPGAEGLIGRRLTWHAGWIIEPDDAAATYVGQWACIVEHDSSWHVTVTKRADSDPVALVTPSMSVAPPFTWVPSGDLVDIEILEGVDVRGESAMTEVRELERLREQVALLIRAMKDFQNSSHEPTAEHARLILDATYEISDKYGAS